MEDGWIIKIKVSCRVFCQQSKMRAAGQVAVAWMSPVRGVGVTWLCGCLFCSARKVCRCSAQAVFPRTCNRWRVKADEVAVCVSDAIRNCILSAGAQQLTVCSPSFPPLLPPLIPGSSFSSLLP
eukprot:2154101-Rhodomonas_salina.5